MTGLTILIIYIIGIFVALFVLTFLNVYADDEASPNFCLFSWFMILYILLAIVIMFCILDPIKKLYNWLYRKIENLKSKSKNE